MGKLTLFYLSNFRVVCGLKAKKPLREIVVYQDDVKSFKVLTAGVSCSIDGTNFKPLGKMQLGRSQPGGICGVLMCDVSAQSVISWRF